MKILSLIFMVILYCSATVPVLPSVKVVRVKIFISPKGRLEFISHGTPVEEMVAKVILAFEPILNAPLLLQANPIKIQFVPEFQTEVPSGIDLDKCDTNMVEITNDLNTFNIVDPFTSVIAFLNCKAMSYQGTFKTVGLRVPYVTHYLSTECTTRTAIFIEAEKPKFLSVFATALAKAAGVTLQNPLSFQEIVDGDNGVKYDILVGTETLQQFKINKCLYNKKLEDDSAIAAPAA